VIYNPLNEISISSYSYAHNVLSSGYPFIEALSCVSRLVDEVIVLDGFSDDGTFEVLELLASKCSKIKLFQCEHIWKHYTHIANSENKARNLTNGDFLIRLHLDEILDIRTIEKIKKISLVNSYLCSSKTLVSSNSIGHSRLPVEGFRIFRKNSNIKSISDGFLSGNFNPTTKTNICFYHMNWYFPAHWKNKVISLGSLWNWQGLFENRNWGSRKDINIENLSENEKIKKVIGFSESKNIVKDNPPFYLKSLDQFSKYTVRSNVIDQILNYGVN